MLCFNKEKTSKKSKKTHSSILAPLLYYHFLFTVHICDSKLDYDFSSKNSRIPRIKIKHLLIKSMFFCIPASKRIAIQFLLIFICGSFPKIYLFGYYCMIGCHLILFRLIQENILRFSLKTKQNLQLAINNHCLSFEFRIPIPGYVL